MKQTSEVDDKGTELLTKLGEIEKQIARYELTKDCSDATMKHLEKELNRLKNEIDDLEDMAAVEDFLHYGPNGKDPK